MSVAFIIAGTQLDIHIKRNIYEDVISAGWREWRHEQRYFPVTTIEAFFVLSFPMPRE